MPAIKRRQVGVGRLVARLAIFLLGPFQVLVDDLDVSSAFRTRKERALLAYLATEAGQRHPRETLGEMFWPERPEGYARTNLRQALAGVRRALGKTGAGALQVNDEFIRFRLQADTWLDSREFTLAWQKVQSHGHGLLENCAGCIQRMQAMVDLYRGDFLADVNLADTQTFPEWTVYHGEQYFRLLLTALHHLINTYAYQGDFETASTFAWRYVSQAPLEEDAHRQVMNLLALTGRRSAALEQYQTCKNLLNSELGVEPSPETQELYERIKTGLGSEISLPGAGSGLGNLPTQPTAFIGREAELAQLDGCLKDPDCHLVTVLGMAGVGKTSLAQAAAMSVRDYFPDGVWQVSLEQVKDGIELANTLAGFLGLPAVEHRRQLVDFYRELRQLKTLLLLDGFEHLVAHSDIPIGIIQQAPGVKLLLTSRLRVSFRAACLFELAGLPWPGPEHTLEQAREKPAVKLFLARAQYSRIGFNLTQANLPELVRICALVDGLPLGLELAAARLRDYTTQQIMVELEHGLDILEVMVEDIPARHRSLRGALQFSWENLPVTEKALFRRLSAFEGEFSAEQALTAADAPRSGLTKLVNHYLLVSEKPGGYRFHPLVRHFALEKQAEEKVPQPAGEPAPPDIHAVSFPGSDWGNQLPGRDLYWDRLERLVARCERQQQQAAVGLLWISNLGDLEREFDRAAVDSILLTVGLRLGKRLRKNDTLAQFSHARFAIILEAIKNPGDIAKVIAKLQRVLESPVEVQGTLVVVQAYLGISIFPWDGHNAEALLERAELALNMAERAGEFYQMYNSGLERSRI